MKEENNLKICGKVFKQLRVQKGLTLEDFANVGISKAALSKFEREKSML